MLYTVLPCTSIKILRFGFRLLKGKLPHAFYCIQDPEAKRFVGRCLQKVPGRSSAKELLFDPFLTFEDPAPKNPANDVKNIVSGNHDSLQVTYHHDLDPVLRTTDMTITGKMNTEDDAIYLKVQIADNEGVETLRSFSLQMHVVWIADQVLI